MKIIWSVFLFISAFNFAQTSKIEKITGSVKILDANDNWLSANEGKNVPDNSIIITEDNSQAKISVNGSTITIKESSAVKVSDIKQMTIDELLLALAMEDLINAPRKKEKNDGKTTAVYGTKEGSENKNSLSNEFGLKRINGAIQLSENGFKESAVIASKEIFRKYPQVKLNAKYRIYFADLLYGLGLYEEAYNEFSLIKEFTLSEDEETRTKEMLSALNKKLVN